MVYSGVEAKSFWQKASASDLQKSDKIGFWNTKHDNDTVMYTINGNFPYFNLEMNFGKKNLWHLITYKGRWNFPYLNFWDCLFMK